MRAQADRASFANCDNKPDELFIARGFSIPLGQVGLPVGMGVVATDNFVSSCTRLVQRTKLVGRIDFEPIHVAGKVACFVQL